MKNLLLFLFLVFITTANCVAQQGSWFWGTQGTNPQMATEGQATAVDRQNNVYMTGNGLGSVTVGNFKIDTAGSLNAFVIKYDTSGNVLWVAQSKAVTLNTYAAGLGIATDNFGNTYEDGIFTGAIFFGTNGLNASDESSYLIKYNSNGNTSWAKQVTLVSNAEAVSFENDNIATDKTGNIYMAGTFGGTIAFDAVDITANRRLSFFLAKYDSSGNVVWAVQPKVSMVTNTNFGPRALCSDKYNDIYETGLFSDTLVVGPDTLISSFSRSCFVAKFDSNGNALWAKAFSENITGAELPAGITAGFDGGIYVTGGFQDTLELGAVKLGSPQGGGTNIFIVKYDSAGNAKWAKSSSSAPNSTWIGFTIVTDSLNHVYISGADQGAPTMDTVQFGSVKLTAVVSAPSDGNSIIMMFDTSGNALCGSMLTVGGDDYNSVAVTPSGKYIYLGGDFESSVKIGPDALPYENTEVPAMARWQPCGECNLAVTVPPSQPVCNGQSVTLTVSGATSYTWSPAMGLNVTTGSSVIASPTVTVTYSVTATGSTGCSVTNDVIVNVIPSPNKPAFTQHNDTLISSSKYDNQWYYDGEILTGDTSQDLIITTLGWYYVEVNNEANGCSTESDSAEIKSLTGINQLAVGNSQLSVYPNPAYNSVFIKINSMESNVSDWNLQLIDVLGRELYSMPSLNYSNEIDLSYLADGFYFITIMTGTGKIMVPIVKE